MHTPQFHGTMLALPFMTARLECQLSLPSLGSAVHAMHLLRVPAEHASKLGAAFRLM